MQQIRPMWLKSSAYWPRLPSSCWDDNADPGTETQAFCPEFGNQHGIEYSELETCPYQITPLWRRTTLFFLGGLDLALW